MRLGCGGVTLAPQQEQQVPFPRSEVRSKLSGLNVHQLNTAPYSGAILNSCGTLHVIGPGHQKSNPKTYAPAAGVSKCCYLFLVSRPGSKPLDGGEDRDDWKETSAGLCTTFASPLSCSSNSMGLLSVPTSNFWRHFGCDDGPILLFPRSPPLMGLLYQQVVSDTVVQPHPLTAATTLTV
jgi:hypothetical protein